MATDILTKAIVDCSTGETTILPLTAEEITQMEADRAQSEIDRAAQEAEAQAKADAKASALAKLAVLGLTEEEAAAIAG
jgi:F0F1-type ATP synthase epsilon subunit